MLSRLTPLWVSVALPACAISEAPRGPSLQIAVAPLNLPGIGEVCYDLRVTNGPSKDDPIVWKKGTPGLNGGTPDSDAVCSSQFGNGTGGDITFVGACDASPASTGATSRTNSVTVWVDGLYDSSNAYIDPLGTNGWQNPCANGCTLTAECSENSDTGVEFNLTILREANQGFFDIGVNFDDIFCSAKVDCTNASGQPIDLLFRPGTSTRDTTIIAALACTGSPGSGIATHLYRDPLNVICGTAPNQTTTSIAPSVGKGNAYTSTSPDPNVNDAVWQYAIYAGDESLMCGASSCNKRYWNVAIGLDETVDNCRLQTAMTASASAFADYTTPTATTYPYIKIDLPLTDMLGLSCTKHALDSSGSISTQYTPISAPEVFDYSYAGSNFNTRLSNCDCQNGGTCPGASSTCICASGWTGTNCTVPDCPQGCLNGTCSGPGVCSCLPGWSGSDCNTATVLQTDLTFYIDPKFPSSYSGTGTTVYDISGSNYSAAMVGNTSYSSENSGYFSFDDSGDYIESNHSNINVGTQFTAEGWAYLNDIGGSTQSALNREGLISNAWNNETGKGFALFATAQESLPGSEPHPNQLFTTNGTFTVPAGVSVIRVLAIGGGGGGGGGHLAYGIGGGGGGGGAVRFGTFSVTPGTVINVTIGSAGTGGNAGGVSGTAGGSTFFGAFLTATGGGGGAHGHFNPSISGKGLGGSGGGSGGGGGGQGGFHLPGAGGTAGGAGATGYPSTAGPSGTWENYSSLAAASSWIAGSGGTVGTVMASNWSGGGGGGGIYFGGVGGVAATGSSSGTYGGIPGDGGRGFGAGGGGGAGSTGTGGQGRSGAVFVEWSLGYTPVSGREALNLTLGKSDFLVTSQFGSVLPRRWFHFAAVANASQPLRLFVNGQETAYESPSAGITSAISYTGRISFGRTNGSNDFANGRLTGLKIYSRALSTSEIQQNYAADLSRFAQTVSDPDAQKFIKIAGIFHGPQARALNDLVVSLKSSGLWTKLKAIYPMLGSRAGAHKFNLKDPRDLDEAYRLTFYGNWTHTDTGATPNGTSAYANTHFVPSTHGTLNSASLAFFGRTNRSAADRTAMGTSSTGPTRVLSIQPFNAANESVGTTYDSGTNASFADTESRGFYLLSRTDSSTLRFYKNGELRSTNTSASTAAAPAIPIFIGALNGDIVTQYDNSECMFASIGDGLTEADVEAFGLAIYRYELAIGRLVLPELMLNLDAANYKSLGLTASTTWNDLSGNGYTGTLNGGVGFAGHFGGQLWLNNDDDYVQTNYQIPTGAAPKSVEIWFSTPSSALNDAGGGWLFSGGSDASAGTGFGLHIGGSPGPLTFRGGGATTLTLNAAMAVSGFYHVIVSYDGTTVRTFVNGLPDATATMSLNTAASAFRLGTSQTNGAADFFRGNLTRVQVHSRALDADEAALHWLATKSRWNL